MRIFILILGAACYGLLSSAGVFTVLVAIGLVPRFAGKTHTADHVILYEEMIIFGTIIGCLFSVFPEYLQIGVWLRTTWTTHRMLWHNLGVAAQMIYGLFSGIFIGCLALAIAEMLDSIPIFSRRIGFRHGLGLAVTSVAAGKLLGSLLYFM